MEEVEEAEEVEEVEEIGEDVEIYRPPLSVASLQWLLEMCVPTEALEDLQDAVAAYIALKVALHVLIEEQDMELV